MVGSQGSHPDCHELVVPEELGPEPPCSPRLPVRYLISCKDSNPYFLLQLTFPYRNSTATVTCSPQLPRPSHTSSCLFLVEYHGHLLRISPRSFTFCSRHMETWMRKEPPLVGYVLFRRERCASCEAKYANQILCAFSFKFGRVEEHAHKRQKRPPAF